VRARVYTGKGNSWCSELNLTPNADFCDEPTIAVTKTRIIMAWRERDSITHQFHPFVRTIKIDTTKIKLQPLGFSSIAQKKFGLVTRNYPNPFNPKTIISYTLFSNSIVTLKVLDVLGREVITLLQNEKIQAGKHEIQFNINTISSGVYFYRIAIETEEREQYNEVKKLIVIK